MMAKVTNLKPGEFIHTLGDTHIYQNHLEQVNVQLGRLPKKLPTIHLNPEIHSLFDFGFEDIILNNYDSHPHIKGEISV